MAIKRSNALRSALMAALNVQRGFDTQIQIRTGVNSGIGGQGQLLAQLTGNSAGWGIVVDGVLTSLTITGDPSAINTGTAGHYQINTAAGIFLESGLLDGTDGVTIDNAAIEVGHTVEMSGSWVNTAAYDDGI